MSMKLKFLSGAAALSIGLTAGGVSAHKHNGLTFEKNEHEHMILFYEFLAQYGTTGFDTAVLFENGGLKYR